MRQDTIAEVMARNPVTISIDSPVSEVCCATTFQRESTCAASAPTSSNVSPQRSTIVPERPPAGPAPLNCCPANRGRPARETSTPEDRRRVAVDLGEQLLDILGGRDAVILVEALVAVTPVQRPQPRRLRVAQPGDREPRPGRTGIRPPWRAAFHDRHMPRRDVDLDADLIADMLRNPSPAPPLHPCDIDLRQNSHTDSLPVTDHRVATFTWIRLTTTGRSGASSDDHTHKTDGGRRDYMGLALGIQLEPAFGGPVTRSEVLGKVSSRLALAVKVDAGCRGW
jgi:hypothetical protein